MFEILFSSHVKDFLKKLDKHIQKRVVDGVQKLSENPFPQDMKHIGRDKENNQILRVRIGDFRALYKVHVSQKIVLIVKIDKRSKVYD